METGDVQVKLVPKDATQATVLVKNTSARPLRIQLPETFVGVPILAQDIGGAGDRGGNNNDSNSSNQSFGGGMGGMGMGGMGMGGMGMGGFFNVPPDATRKIKVATVCLEHGKPDPNPRVAYELKPIDSFTKDAKVIQLCKMLGRGEIDQNAAQAAAWHLTAPLSWPQLAAKVRIRHLNGTTELYFSQQTLQRAMMTVQEAGRRAQDEAVAASSDEGQPAYPYAQSATDLN